MHFDVTATAVHCSLCVPFPMVRKDRTAYTGAEGLAVPVVHGLVLVTHLIMVIAKPFVFGEDMHGSKHARRCRNP